MDFQLTALLQIMHRFPMEVVSVIVLLVSLLLLVMAWRFLGVMGLYIYQVVVLLAANIQVLRLTPSLLSPEPVALGTIIFATTYVAQDMINRFEGEAAAYRGVWIGFLAQFMFSITMYVSLAYAPLVNDGAYQAMERLFVPSIRLMISSLVAFWASHMLNVKLFTILNQKLHWPLWIKVSLVAWVATFVDHVLFSCFAWQIFAEVAIGWSSLWYSYVFPSFVPRVLITLLSSPMVYFVGIHSRVRHV